MPPVNVGLVGAGALSSRRIYPYLAPAGAKLRCVCDLDPRRAREKADLYGGDPFTDVSAMLRERAEDLDCVIICVGPEQHAELAQQVLRSGLPVYTEKPPAATAHEALEVARLARDLDILCTTAFKKRYAAAYERAKEWLSKFPEDDLYSLSINYASGHYSNQDARSSFLLDFAIHVIDVAAFLFGPAEKVACFERDHSAYAVSIRFRNGSVGSLNLTSGRSFGLPTEEVEITVKGGNWMTIHNSSTWRIAENQAATEWREPPTFISAGDSGNETGHLAELVEFFEAVRAGRKSTRSNIYESYRSMVLYEAINEAAETGRIIDIDYADL